MAGLPITRLLVHDAPYNLEASQGPDSQRYLTDLLDTLRAGRHADAVTAFLMGVGVPAEPAAHTGRQLAPVAPTLAYDSAAMGDVDGGLVPLAALRGLGVPTTVIAGTGGAPFFVDVAERLVDVIPDADLVLLEGHGHDAPADAVAPVLLDALR